MTAEVTNLLWRGARTVDAAKAALERGVRVDVSLPAGYHQAVCARFAAGPRGGVQAFDVEGGAELFARLARIHGLEPLAGLETPASRVRIVSPSPTVSIVSERARAEPTSP